MITSPQNEKLKLIRSLHERRGRERADLFLSEGEDLLDAGLASGAEPRLLLSAASSGIGGLEVEPALLDGCSTLGSGTRVIAAWQRPAPAPIEGPVCVYLHALSDPANVGAVIRSTNALVDGTVVLGPGCADPLSPKAVRASMGSVFSQPFVHAGLEATPAPRIALIAHGGEPSVGLPTPLTLCLGAERAGLPADLVEACDGSLTIPLRPGVESLNVAAAAAIVLQGISSPAPEGGPAPAPERTSDG